MEVAAQVIGEKGYHRMSLEEVARRAGMTRGAIYGNFSDKDELILQVLMSQWQSAPPVLKPGGTLKEHMRAAGEAIATVIHERRSRAVGIVSFQLYALTHEAMRKRLTKVNAEIYRRSAEGLLRFVPEEDLPMPADQFVRVMHALRDGLMVLSFLTPEFITDEVIVGAFEALA